MLPYFESLSLSKQRLIRAHLLKVMEYNEHMNLTRIDDEQEGLILHIEDSLSALPELENAPEGQYGDLGSGAGFPGIPLAIATGRKTTLIDTRKKKMDAVQAIAQDLGIGNQIDVFAGRAELLARKTPGAYAVLTARALAKIAVLLELASPLLKQGGRLICYKSHVDEEEYENALRVQQLVGMKLQSDRSFVLADTYDRRLLVFERKGPCKEKLPRKEGMPQKNPL